MAVARHDLGGGRLGLEAELGAHVLLHMGRDVGVGPHRAAHLSDGDRARRPRQPGVVSSQLECPGELYAHRGGLRPNPVGAADHDRVAVLHRPRPDHLEKAFYPAQQQGDRIAQLDGAGGVEDV